MKKNLVGSPVLVNRFYIQHVVCEISTDQGKVIRDEFEVSYTVPEAGYLTTIHTPFPTMELATRWCNEQPRE